MKKASIFIFLAIVVFVGLFFWRVSNKEKLWLKQATECVEKDMSVDEFGKCWPKVATVDAKNNPSASQVNLTDPVFLAGKLTKPKLISWQYGDYVLEGNYLDGSVAKKVKKFALKAKNKTQNLDKWIGKRIIITGTKVKSYPIDFGPDLI